MDLKLFCASIVQHRVVRNRPNGSWLKLLWKGYDSSKNNLWHRLSVWLWSIEKQSVLVRVWKYTQLQEVPENHTDAIIYCFELKGLHSFFDGRPLSPKGRNPSAKGADRRALHLAQELCKNYDLMRDIQVFETLSAHILYVYQYMQLYNMWLEVTSHFHNYTHLTDYSYFYIFRKPNKQLT